MKIASFVRDGEIDCGLVDGDQGYRVFDNHPVIGSLNSESRIFHLLGLSPEERDRVDEEMKGAPLISSSEIKLLPAIPHCPLYIYNHANNPTVWKRQMNRVWEVTRLPYMRIRSYSCFSGDGWEIPIHPGTTLTCGAELGVVIGREAYRVPPEKAVEHIAGLVCLNDNFINGDHEAFIDNSSPESEMHQHQGLHVLFKTGDGNGGMGPWITTAEEFEKVIENRLQHQASDRYRQVHAASWVYDKMMWTKINGEICDEAYTGTYLFGAEWMITYLSRFMTLPTGSIVGLGAAGWDGVHLPSMDEPGTAVEVAVELQGVGASRTTVRRQAVDEVNESPYIKNITAAGLDPTKAVQKRPGRSLWVQRGNNPESDPGLPVTGLNPILFPTTALKEDASPIILPPHATSIRLSVQVAGIIGPGFIYGLGSDGRKINEEECIERICLLVSVRDTSLIDAIKDPFPYEMRAAYFFSSCADGFFRLGDPLPYKNIEDLSAQTIKMSLPGIGEHNYSIADYRFGFSEMLAMISRTITLFPGDVLSLGAAGAELAIPADTKIEKADTSDKNGNGILSVNASWGATMRLTFDDQRDSQFLEVKR